MQSVNMAAAAYVGNKKHRERQHKQHKNFTALQNSINGIHHLDADGLFEDDVVKKSLKNVGKRELYDDDDFMDLPTRVRVAKEKQRAKDLYLEDTVFAMSERVDASGKDIGPWMPVKAMLGAERIYLSAPCWNKEGKETEVVVEDLPLLLISWARPGKITTPADASAGLKIVIDEDNWIFSQDGRGKKGYKQHFKIAFKNVFATCNSLFRLMGLIPDEEDEVQIIRVQQPPAINPLKSTDGADSYLQIFVSCSGKPAHPPLAPCIIPLETNLGALGSM